MANRLNITEEDVNKALHLITHTHSLLAFIIYQEAIYKRFIFKNLSE